MDLDLQAWNCNTIFIKTYILFESYSHSYSIGLDLELHAALLQLHWVNLISFYWNCSSMLIYIDVRKGRDCFWLMHWEEWVCFSLLQLYGCDCFLVFVLAHVTYCVYTCFSVIFCPSVLQLLTDYCNVRCWISTVKLYLVRTDSHSRSSTELLDYM